MQEIKVELLNYTPLSVATTAGLICTASEDKIIEYNDNVFLSKLAKAGHESVLEHINYNFVVSGISRSVLQQLARHRHISLSVQSTRWALKKLFANKENKKIGVNIFPESSTENEIVQQSYARIKEKYWDIMRALADLSENGESNDIVKYYLPEAFITKLMLTVNARELRWIFKLRTSGRALKEFRDLCQTIYNAIPYDHRFLYDEYFVKIEE